MALRLHGPCKRDSVNSFMTEGLHKSLSNESAAEIKPVLAPFHADKTCTYSNYNKLAMRYNIFNNQKYFMTILNWQMSSTLFHRSGGSNRRKNPKLIISCNELKRAKAIFNDFQVKGHKDKLSNLNTMIFGFLI